jgi:hypothetical protein
MLVILTVTEDNIVDNLLKEQDQSYNLGIVPDSLLRVWLRK